MAPDVPAPEPPAEPTVAPDVPAPEPPAEPDVPAPEPPAEPTVATVEEVVVVEPTAVSAPVVARGEAIYRSLNYDLATVGYSISFHPRNEQFLGLTFTRRRHIEIYDRTSMSDADLAHVIAHEIGHAVDHILNDLDDRNRWRSARGIDANIRWWPGEAAPDRATPAGDFAECFGTLLAGSPSQSAWGSCDAQLDLIAELARG